MPHIIEHPDCYEYTGPSGVPVRFAKVDPPELPPGMPTVAELLAGIRANDPEASTIEKYVPKDGVSLAAFKSHMVDLEDGAIYERAETESAKWPAKVRIQWANGAIIRRNDQLYSAIGACGITTQILDQLLVIAEKDNAVS